MACNKSQGGGVFPVRQGDTRISRGSYGRSHTRNDIIGYAGFNEYFHLFTTASENKRVTPFEPGHGQAFSGLFNKQLVDLVLLQGVVAPLFAHINLLGTLPGIGQQIGGGQIIVYQDICIFYTGFAFESNQTGISRTCAYQINMTVCFLHWLSSCSFSMMAMAPWPISFWASSAPISADDAAGPVRASLNTWEPSGSAISPLS